MSEHSRVIALAAAFGFLPECMGAGCTALSFPAAHGGYILITAEHGADIPASLTAACAIGGYYEDGTQKTRIDVVPNLSHALITSHLYL